MLRVFFAVGVSLHSGRPSECSELGTQTHTHTCVCVESRFVPGLSPSASSALHPLPSYVRPQLCVWLCAENWNRVPLGSSQTFLSLVLTLRVDRTGVTPFAGGNANSQKHIYPGPPGKPELTDRCLPALGAPYLCVPSCGAGTCRARGSWGRGC